MSEKEALDVRDTLTNYYGETLHDDPKKMLQAVELAQQRLADYRLRAYTG